MDTAGNRVTAKRWGTWWTHSLRARLVALSLAPFVIAFPLIMAVVIAIGGSSFDRVLGTNALGKVEGVRTYLDQIKVRALETSKQHATSERLTRPLAAHASAATPQRELTDALAALARENQFDFLLIADKNGKIIAASTGAKPDSTVPRTFVTRQAYTGVATVEYEALTGDQVSAISPVLAERARIAAVQLVLEVSDQGADLFTTLDRNFDRVLTPRELQAAPQVLATEDRDGDGYLGGIEMSYSLVLELSRGGSRPITNTPAAAMRRSTLTKRARGWRPATPRARWKFSSWPTNTARRMTTPRRFAPASGSN